MERYPAQHWSGRGGASPKWRVAALLVWGVIGLVVALALL